MFNEEDNSWWEEESEIDKIKKEFVLSRERDKKEYIRYTTLYNYIKSSTNISLLYFHYEDNAVETLENMLAIFLKKEEYEKCADIRDWLIDVKEHKSKTNDTSTNKHKKENILQNRITF